MQDYAMGSSAISSCRNYLVKRTSIQVVKDDPETRSQERGRRSSSRSAAMDRLECGDDESDTSSTHSFESFFESFSRTSSSPASSLQAHRSMPHERMSSRDADGESFGSRSLENTFSCTDDDSSEDGEEGEELEGSRSMKGSERSSCHMEHRQRVLPGPCKSARRKCRRRAAALGQVKQEEPEKLDTTVEHLHKLSQRRYLQAFLQLRKMQDAAGLEDAAAELSDQADQAVRMNIISL